jgi:hypothetical protein
MGIANRLDELKIARQKPETFCAYQSLYDTLPKEDQKALDDAWAKGLSANVVLSALRSEGIKSSNESIRAHRSGVCKCLKK